MKYLARAITTKLRSISALSTLAGYTATNQSIALVEPKQKILKPGIYVDFSSTPLPDADSTAVKKAEVTLFLIAKTRVTVMDMAHEIEGLFRDTNGHEKHIDFGDNSVYCISSLWDATGSPSWNDDLDCFELTLNLSLFWSLK